MTTTFLARRRMIGVDFDGTVASYSHWQGEDVVGAPIPGAIEFLRALHEAGYDLVIFSARAGTSVGKRAIWGWVKDNGVEDIISDVTNVKLYSFYRIIDDRAIGFRGDYGRVKAELV